SEEEAGLGAGQGSGSLEQARPVEQRRPVEHGRPVEPSRPLDLSRSVGWFTSLYPVRLEPGALGSSDAELAAALRSVKEQLRAVPDRGLGYGALRYLGAPEVQAALRDGAPPEITFN